MSELYWWKHLFLMQSRFSSMLGRQQMAFLLPEAFADTSSVNLLNWLRESVLKLLCPEAQLDIFCTCSQVYRANIYSIWKMEKINNNILMSLAATTGQVGAQQAPKIFNIKPRPSHKNRVPLQAPQAQQMNHLSEGIKNEGKIQAQPCRSQISAGTISKGRRVTKRMGEESQGQELSEMRGAENRRQMKEDPSIKYTGLRTIEQQTENSPNDSFWMPKQKEEYNNTNIHSYILQRTQHNQKITAHHHFDCNPIKSNKQNSRSSHEAEQDSLTSPSNLSSCKQMPACPTIPKLNLLENDAEAGSGRESSHGLVNYRCTEEAKLSRIRLDHGADKQITKLPLVPRRAINSEEHNSYDADPARSRKLRVRKLKTETVDLGVKFTSKSPG